MKNTTLTSFKALPAMSLKPINRIFSSLNYFNYRAVFTPEVGKMKTKFFLLALFFCFTNARTQVTEEWVQRFNDALNENDGAQSVAVDVSGNVYVSGWAFNSLTGYDYTLLKYNPS